MKIASIIVCIKMFLLVQLFPQDGSDVLFTIDDTEVTVDEFLYIFNKNNPEGFQADVEDARNYLDMYVNFKLKVHRAREIELDTLPTLREELEGYRRQLSKSFLMNREVMKRLVEELFERKQYDINVSHLLVEVEAGADDSTAQAAYEEANRLREKLMGAESFSEVARVHSDDPSARQNGGNIGYLTAPLPDGFYEFETAVYKTEVGEFSKPVRSNMGYHVIRVNDRRTARGEVELAHILIRFATDESAGPSPEEKVETVLEELEGGKSFREVAQRHSEDAATANRGGYVGFAGINLFERSFEDAAFSIPEDGAYTGPVETRVGYHIIQRISKRPLSDFEKMKPLLEQQLEDSDRKDIAMQALIERIKEEAKYERNEDLLTDFIATLDEDFFSYRWRVPEDLEDDILFTIGGREYKLAEFAENLRRNTRMRLRMSRETDLDYAVRKLYKEFSGDAAISYQESILEDTYPEFRALMREYEEGILLFELTRRKVWDRASEDEEGLRQFYEENAHNYMTRETAEVVTFFMENANQRLSERMYSFAEDNHHSTVVSRFDGRRGMEVTTQIDTLDVRNMPDELEMSVGSKTELTPTGEDSFTFSKVESIIPPRQRKLEEARGFVIADYQDKLEKEWMADLKDKYTIELDREVVERVMKKWK